MPTILTEAPPEGKRIRIKDDCPMSGLNQLFPVGIPVHTKKPTIITEEYACYELDFGSRAIDVCELMQAVFSQDAPVELCRIFLVWNIIAIPSAWVQGEFSDANR